MYIQSVEIQGLADLPYCLLQEIPSSGMTFQEATPETTALGDALAIWFAAFDEMSLVDLLVQWGWAQEEDIEVFGEGLVEEVSWFDGTCSSMWVEDRTVSISLDIGLDNDTVQTLRQLIANPEVQVALMSEPTFSATLSMRWSNDHQVMGLSFTSIRLGQWRMPTEKPVWYLQLMRVFYQRFFRNHNRFMVAECALSTMLSIDGFTRYQSFQQACAKWGELRVVSILDREPMLLINDRRIRRWGAEMESTIRVLASWHLVSSDIVWSDRVLSERPMNKQIWGIAPGLKESRDGSALNARSSDVTLRFPKS